MIGETATQFPRVLNFGKSSQLNPDTGQRAPIEEGPASTIAAETTMIIAGADATNVGDVKTFTNGTE